MKYCKNCNLKINGNQQNCFFCGNKLELLNNENLSSFPSKKPRGYYVDKIKKIVLFSLIVLIAISILLEYYLFSDRLYWLFVSLSSVFIYCVVSVSLNNSKGIVAKLSNISMLVTLESILIFSFFDIGIYELCLTYVFPGVCIINLLSGLIIYIITKGKNVFDQLLYLFFNAFYGLISFGFIILDLVEITFICAICGALSILVLLFLFLFLDKESKEEIKRRFHI